MPAFAPLGLERLSLAEALGRYLAEDVAARSDLPQFDNSSMDGYAVRARDTDGGENGPGAGADAAGGDGAGGPDGNAPSPCRAGEKACAGRCVPVDDPLFGCAATSCGSS